MLAFIVAATAAAAQDDLILTPGEIERVFDWRRDTYLQEKGKTAVDCSSIPRGPGTAALLVLGQSNASNEGQGRQPEKAHVYNFNVFTGRCFMAADPLLGTTGKDAGFLVRLGARLVDARLYSDVVLVPIAVGGSRIEDWAPRGAHYPRVLLAARRLKAAGFPVSFVLWQQGEANASRDFSPRSYKETFGRVLDALRSQDIGADVFVAQASICRTPPHAGLRTAQAELVDPRLGVYAGPDTDSLGKSERFDGCHFSSSGQDRHARLWFETLRQFIEAKDRSALPRVNAKTIGAGADHP